MVASDECYAELGWSSRRRSRCCTRTSAAATTSGLLVLHSLSKQSNMAGYRAAFVAGDPALVRELLEVRKHAGMMVPAPVQAAMVAALGDDAHVAEQRQRYAVRREALLPALTRAGFRVDHSEAGLYLWATRDEDCWATVEQLAAPRHPGRAGLLLRPGRRPPRARRPDRDRRAHRRRRRHASLPPSGPATYGPTQPRKGSPLSTATCTWSRWRSTGLRVGPLGWM